MSTPRVSIIVPVYNVDSYIRKCIDSILTQTYTDYELILVDDGSTDMSGDICEKYSVKDSRVKVIHKINGGQSSARNIGIDNAKGEYLSFIDADDYVSPIMIETLLNLIDNNNADISECGYITVNKEIETVCDFGKDVEMGAGNYLIEKFINADIFYGVCTKLFKKSLFDNTRFPNGRIYEDTWMTLYFCLSSLKYVRTQQPLYYYFQRENSTLHSELNNRKAREFIILLENLLKLVDNKVNDIGIKKRIYKRIMENSVFWYLGLALSDKRNIRRIYSKLYLRRMDYGIIDCIRSKTIPIKNKISYTLCRMGFTEYVKSIKK